MTFISKIKTFLNQCKITLRLTKRPTKDEFYRVSLISGLGILIVGAIGFVIYLIYYYLF